MDNIIKQILEIDAQAQERLQRAREERDTLKAQVDQDALKAADDLRRECEARVQKIYAQEKEAADEEIAALRKDTAEHQTALEALFQENKAVWADEIAKAVLDV